MKTNELEWYFKNYRTNYILHLLKKFIKTNDLNTIIEIAYASNNKYAIEYLETYFQEQVLKYSIDCNNLELFKKIITKYPEIITENEKLNIFNKIQTQINLCNQKQKRIEEKRKQEKQRIIELNKVITMWGVTKNNDDYLYVDD